jgi:hypothetical protein
LDEAAFFIYRRRRCFVSSTTKNKKMKHFSKLTLLIAIFFFCNQQSGAQSIKGIVTDSISRQVLANASVSLSKNGNDLNILSTAKGDFIFSGLDTTGLYRLSVQYAGYRTFVQDSISTSHATIFEIILAPDQKEMAGVTVTTAKPFIVMKNDKIVVNVAQSPVAAGGNVYEAVKKAPGITDMQGLQFRGKNVTVYINDKPSRLGGEDLKNYLSSMPANTVERIEVITNPSAKYEASGGPVVNIILAKNKDLGTNGTVTAGTGAGRYGRFNSGISLNHRNANMNVYGSYDYQYTKVRNRTRANRSFNDLYSISDEQRSYETSKSNIAKAGLDYTINSRSSIGALVRGVFSDRDKNINNQSLVSTDSSSLVTNNNHAQLSTVAANLYYRTKLGKTGDLSLNADYFSYDKDRNDNFTTRYYDDKGLEYVSPYLLRANAPANNRIKSFSADYTFSANDIAYEAGLKSVLTRTDNSSVWERTRTAPGKMIYRKAIGLYMTKTSMQRICQHPAASANLTWKPVSVWNTPMQRDIPSPLSRKIRIAMPAFFPASALLITSQNKNSTVFPTAGRSSGLDLIS